MNPTVIYDFNPDGTERPVWLKVDFDESLSNFPEKILYIDVAKYNTEFIGTFSDENMGASVIMNELVSGRNNHEFGIDLLSIISRVREESSSIRRLIILISNITEILAYSETV
jgi:hypothetical protein